MSVISQGSASWIVAWSVRVEVNGEPVILRGSSRTGIAGQRDVITTVVEAMVPRRRPRRSWRPRYVDRNQPFTTTG